jgi:hypothetical protein
LAAAIPAILFLARAILATVFERPDGLAECANVGTTSCTSERISAGK